MKGAITAAASATHSIWIWRLESDCKTQEIKQNRHPFPPQCKILEDHLSITFETMSNFHQNVTQRRWTMILEAKTSKQSCETEQRARGPEAPPSSLLHQWHQLTRCTIIKPGLRPCSKLLFGDKSILQSQADGHLAHCNCSLSLLSSWRAPLTDVEPHRTCWLTRTAGRTKQGSDGQPGIPQSPPPVLLINMSSSTMRRKKNNQKPPPPPPKENTLIK